MQLTCLFLLAAALGSGLCAEHRLERPDAFGLGHSHQHGHSHGQHSSHQWIGKMLNNFRNQQQNLFGNSAVWNSNINSNWARQWQSLLGDSSSSAMSWKPWWQGENVCKREEKTESKAGAAGDDDSEQTMSSLMSHFSSSLCEDTDDAYTCTMTVSADGRLRRLKTVYECCHGWTRLPGDNDGCTTEENLEPLLATLETQNLTRLVEVIESVGLSDVFEEAANRTVFAPTNQALAAIQQEEDLSPVLLDGTDQDEFIRQIVNAHVVDGWSRRRDWHDEQLLQTRNPDATIRINQYTSGLWTANCVPLESTSAKADNGVVHTVDRLMLPAKQSLWNIISYDPRFSVMAALVDEQLQERLMATDAHFTLFAFTNDAFERLPAQLQQQITGKQGCLADLMPQLLVDTTVCSAAIQRESRLRNTQGQYINATRTADDKVLFNGVPVLAADRMATNGVVHILQDVLLFDHLLPIQNVASRLNPDLEIGGLFEDWDTERESTVFVPPAGSLLQLDTQSPDDYRQLLNNHVLENELIINRFNPKITVNTLAGNELSMSVQRPSLSSLLSPAGLAVNAHIQCARLTNANQQTCNGVLHQIDKPLVIAQQNLLQLLEADDEYSDFVSMLRRAGADQLLADEDFRGTVLAVNNSALDDDLSNNDRKQLEEDEELLKDFVEKHILRDAVCCHALGTQLASIFGSSSHTTVNGQVVFSVPSGSEKLPNVGGAAVTHCDRIATNGILHKVNQPVSAQRRLSIQDLLSGVFTQPENGSRRTAAVIDDEDDGDMDDFGWF